MNEMDELLERLRNLKQDSVDKIHNSKEIWKKIGLKDFIGAGFNNQEEAIKWIEENDYSEL